MRAGIVVCLAGIALFLNTSFVRGQEQKKAETPAKEEKPEDEGIPITSELVQKSCSPCHKIDEKKRMSRISYRRTTPEGWQQTLKRMVSLNKLQLEPEAARAVLKYLSNSLGLAPEEARPGAFEVEKRMIDYKYSDKDTEQVCGKCHSMGRVILQRRTKEEWELLVAMHRGYYPLSDFQAFRRMGPPQTEPGPDGRPPDNRHPMEKAVAHLSGAFPLKTAEWAAWSANTRPPRLQGRWALSGYQLGKGPVYGQVVISPVAGAEDAFATEIRYTYARSGRQVARAGKTLVYTGFQWRGRSAEGANDATTLREVMFVERDWTSLSGRWFSGAYDETGMDVRLRRIGSDPILLGVDRGALKTSSVGKAVKIFGVNLPATLAPSDIDFGPGIKVTRVNGSSAESATVEVDVARDAPVGARDLYVSGAACQGAVVVYDKVDGLKVTPLAGLARIGGINFPKQYQQFEAVAYHNGPDGKPDTKDDLNLGMVDVAWSIEEYTATFGDDDRNFVGTLDAHGLFTPNVDGPNPQRRNGTNNYGDVWIVATYTPEDKGAKPIRARAHLVVTVPLYMKFDQPEVTH
jgi:quinohemoprotein amine dehydrogenase